jgi:MFS family permease
MQRKRLALQFILLLGIVSLFGDIAYEGARGVVGPFLAVLGLSAGMVGLITGFGEFIAYVFRLFSGYVGDYTKKYWLLTIIGYTLILSIPMLAFASYWQIAAILLIIERIGKGIRSPARDTLLSHATKQVGRGYGFGIHEALDQLGAIIGPLIFSFFLFLNFNYSQGFIIMFIPVILSLVSLLLAKQKVPLPEKFEVREKKNKTKLPKIFWFYLLFTFLSVLGFANFQLISFHMKTKSLIQDAAIPFLYALAMGFDALTALLVGKFYDKVGLKSLILAPLLTIFIPLLGFSSSYLFVALSGIFLGSVLAIHETIMRAAVADLTSTKKRGFAYGVFHTVYGLALFLGSLLIGFLYEISTPFLIFYIILLETISLVLLFNLQKKLNGHGEIRTPDLPVIKTGGLDRSSKRFRLQA